MNNPLKICVVIVTFNRKELLLKSINVLTQQTYPLNKIIIIDNASTDNTEEILKNSPIFDPHLMTYIKLDQNYGGAGGFHFGVKKALELEPQWLYLIDDDAIAQPDTIEQLAQQLKNKDCIYAPIALNENKDTLCWPICININNKKKRINSFKDIKQELVQVDMIPFLGFTIHSHLVKKIGLPDKDYFISGDDVEYGNRVLKLNHSIYLVTKSILSHPLPARYTISFLGISLNCLVLDPWRRYYDTRNRLLNNKQKYGLSLRFFLTLSVIITKLPFVLIKEQQRWSQIKAHYLGIFHGLVGIKGKKIEPGQL